MDIEKAKKLVTSEIEAGRETRTIREVFKADRIMKHDAYDKTSEL